MEQHRHREKYILAIDLGTSGPKSALVSVRGEIVDYEFQETQLFLLSNGGAEQDPQEWWQAVLNTSKRVLSKNLVPVDDIVAVSCSAQWSGTVAVDREGVPLMNGVIWLDSRGSRYIRDITGGPIKVSGYGLQKIVPWMRLTGGAPTHSGKDSIAHILYIRHERPEVYQKTFKFLEPKDYLNLCFTGKFASTCDTITLHWVTDNRDIRKIGYHDRLLKMSTLDRGKLPDLIRAVDILGPIKKDVAEELGLNESVQVIGGTPDVPCAAIGSGAVLDYQAHLYIGTSAWLTCHVPYKKTDILHNMASLPSAVPDRYFVANEQETAGACLTFLRDNIVYHKDELLKEEKLPDVYKIFDKIVADVPAGSDKLIFTPWLYGERTPIDDHTVRAALFNQSLRTTRSHVVRAVFEGVAYNAKWLLNYVEKFVKRQLDNIHIIGGGAHSNIWCQIFADVFDRSIRQVKDPIQANVRGAGFLASLALGYIELSDIPDLVEIDCVYQPNPDHRDLYDELYNEFLNIYKCNRKIYQRLNRDG
jgi:xylulokinase